MKYCPNCGNQLYDAAVMCPNCHKDLSPAQKLYTVTVSRSVQKVILFDKDMVVYIDNQPQGGLKNGTQNTYRLPAGVHKMVITYAGRTKSVDFNLQNDINFKTEWNRFTGGIDIFQL